MKTLKRIITLLLAVLMICVLAVPAFAGQHQSSSAASTSVVPVAPSPDPSADPPADPPASTLSQGNIVIVVVIAVIAVLAVIYFVIKSKKNKK